MQENKKELYNIIIAGAIVGLAGVLLAKFGNPGNMGFCIACFIRDSAGALKMHTAPVVQYLRPEIIGLILGSFIISLVKKEFRPYGGSSPVSRFLLGMSIMIGALIFLGCPLRMVLRMGAGDLNAWVAFLGFALGIYVATLFLNKGFSLGRAYKQNISEGIGMPLIQIILLAVFLFMPKLLAFSEEGPGSKHAPVWMSLGFALVIGAVLQMSRLCMAGSLRDIFVMKDFRLFYGSAAILVVALIGSIATSSFNFSFADQPIAHSEHLWNILGMFLVGFASVLAGGCPIRQLILTGTGNGDSALTVVGMAVGAACCHNFGWASSGKGTTAGGRAALIVAMIYCFYLAYSQSVAKKA